MYIDHDYMPNVYTCSFHRELLLSREKITIARPPYSNFTSIFDEFDFEVWKL